MGISVEDKQRHQLKLYYRQVLKPKYPALGFVVIENRGYKTVTTEKSHPDCLWRLYHNGKFYWLFHELKKKGGVLDAGQKEWWARFKETDLVKGVVTKGLAEHYAAIDNWLLQFYPDHTFKKIA